MEEPALELSELPRLMPDAFSREDEGDDRAFYRDGWPSPPLDALALETVERLIDAVNTVERPEILDLMAGSETHLPAGLRPARLVGLGLDKGAMQANGALDEIVLHDLNADPAMPFPDGSFDVVLNTFSVEYLTRPLEVFDEAGRVLRHGGLLLVVFSNRKVRRKSIQVWRQLTERRRRILVEEMVRVCGSFERVGTFRSVGFPRPADDTFLATGLPSDPIYAVYADRIGGVPNRPPRPCPPSAFGVPIDREVLRLREREVGHTLRCPYCEGPLTPWDVPQTPFTEWSCEQMYICLDNRCPYYCRSWSAMDEQGNPGFGYRLMYNPERDRCMPTPAAGLKARMETVVNPRG